MPGTLNALFVSSINGGPFSSLVTFGSFDADCRWSLPVTIPPGLPPLDVGFVLFGADKTTGQIAMTGEALVVFQ